MDLLMQETAEQHIKEMRKQRDMKAQKNLVEINWKPIRKLARVNKKMIKVFQENNLNKPKIYEFAKSMNNNIAKCY